MPALCFGTFGEPLSVLNPILLNLPSPGIDDVHVRMRLRPVNPSDLYQIRGRYGRLPELPAIAGLEGMGVVEAVGSGARGITVGQRIVFREIHGTWADVVVTHEPALIPVPDDVPDEAAAQAIVNPLTAYAMIQDLAPPEGSWILLTAAGSAVGR